MINKTMQHKKNSSKTSNNMKRNRQRRKNQPQLAKTKDEKLAAMEFSEDIVDLKQEKSQEVKRNNKKSENDIYITNGSHW